MTARQRLELNAKNFETILTVLNEFFHVIVNMLTPGCLVAAQSTRILHPFMNFSSMLSKIRL